MEAHSTPAYCTIKEAERRVFAARSKVYRLINSGSLKAVKSGARTLITTASIDAYLASLPAYEPRAAA